MKTLKIRIIPAIVWLLCLILKDVTLIKGQNKVCRYNHTERYIDCENDVLGVIGTISQPKGQPAIQYLYLMNTHAVRVQSDAFNALPELLLIDLRDNQITTLEYNVFSKQSELRSLSLMNNRLSSLPDNRIFAALGQLIYLNLQNNLLQYLSYDVLLPMVSLSQLHLAGNPFVCDQIMYYTLMFCESRKLKPGINCPNIQYNPTAKPCVACVGSETDTPQEDTRITESGINREPDIPTTELANTSREVFIKETTVQVLDTSIITIAVFGCITVVAICSVPVAIWVWKKRMTIATEQSVSRLHMHNFNMHRPVRSYVSVVPEPPPRPIVTLSKPGDKSDASETYDDIVNYVKEENYYATYVMPQ